ncbi:MAG: uracil phosphoribosyltransferase [Clostridia bacterium]|nr:uracil phosphoribosyltransferase [Clostridia bacterium]
MANFNFANNSKFHHVKHPLIEHKLAILRDINTTTKQFMELAEEIAMLLTYEATKDLPLEEVTVETPLERAKCYMVSGKAVGIVPILRAGLGMVSGVQKLIPNAKVGHIGLYRDHDTHEPVEYYCKLPADAEQRTLIVVDPMLATGGSASDAITMIKKRGVTKIKLCCIVSAPEGVQKVLDDHPDVDVYVASLDRCLNENCYILPGLGDAGDRLFGTK